MLQTVFERQLPKDEIVRASLAHTRHAPYWLEALGERPASRTDLHDGAPLERAERVHDRLERSTVVQEMLTQSLARWWRRAGGRGPTRRT